MKIGDQSNLRFTRSHLRHIGTDIVDAKNKRPFWSLPNKLVECLETLLLCVVGITGLDFQQPAKTGDQQTRQTPGVLVWRLDLAHEKVAQLPPHRLERYRRALRHPESQPSVCSRKLETHSRQRGELTSGKAEGGRGNRCLARVRMCAPLAPLELYPRF